MKAAVVAGVLNGCVCVRERESARVCVCHRRQQ